MTGIIVLAVTFGAAALIQLILSPNGMAKSKITQYGFINKTGSWVIPPKYEAAGNFACGVAPVAMQVANGETAYGYIDRTGKIILQPVFGGALPFKSDYAEVGCTFGNTTSSYLINHAGRVIARCLEGHPDYEGQMLNSEGAEFLYKRGLWGITDKQGKVLVEPIFQGLGMMREGLAPAVKGERIGYVNTNGKWIIQPRFEMADEFSCGLARVGRHIEQKRQDGGRELNEQYGYIDRTGKLVIAFKYSNGLMFSEGLAAVQDAKSTQWGFIDTKGKQVLPAIYFSPGRFINGQALITQVKGDKDGCKVWDEYIDKQGRTLKIIPSEEPNNQQLVRIRWNGKTGYATRTGKIVITPKYEEARDFSEGFAAVGEFQRWGFINTKGELVVQKKYREVRDFHNGLAAVEEPVLWSGKWSYIGSNGQTAITGQFKRAESFGEGLAYVERQSLLGTSRELINKEGKIVATLAKDMRVFGEFSDGLAPACTGHLAELEDPEQMEEMNHLTR